MPPKALPPPEPTASFDLVAAPQAPAVPDIAVREIKTPAPPPTVSQAESPPGSQPEDLARLLAEARSQAEEARRQVARSQEESSALRYRLADAGERRRGVPVGAVLLAIAVCAMVYCARTVEHPDQHQIAPRSAATSSAAASNASHDSDSSSAPAPQSNALDATAQAERLARLLGALPGPAVAEVLGAANQELASRGQPPCSVKTARGDVSMLIVSGENFPLARAYARCADSVETVMGHGH